MRAFPGLGSAGGPSLLGDLLRAGFWASSFGDLRVRLVGDDMLLPFVINWWWCVLRVLFGSRADVLRVLFRSRAGSYRLEEVPESFDGHGRCASFRAPVFPRDCCPQLCFRPVRDWNLVLLEGSNAVVGVGDALSELGYGSVLRQSLLLFEPRLALRFYDLIDGVAVDDGASLEWGSRLVHALDAGENVGDTNALDVDLAFLCAELLPVGYAHHGVQAGWRQPCCAMDSVALRCGLN